MERVNVDNFARAETNRMFSGILANSKLNEWGHNRVATPIDQQTVIRMNRDTLYSFTVVDISKGATLTLPDAGDRYLSVMVVNQDHYINKIYHDPGEYTITMEEFGTPYVLLAARTLVDDTDPADVTAVNKIQDGLAVRANSAKAFEMPEYDTESFTETREALLQLGKGMGGTAATFGRREDVEPVRHLIGTALGWGGLPEEEAFYVNVNPDLPVGEYNLSVRDVPVDAFWSISLYNAQGFFEKNDRNAYSVNSVTGTKAEDGSITIRFGGDPSLPNSIPIMDGWNYIVRLYRPRPEILDGSWTFPTLQPFNR